MIADVLRLHNLLGLAVRALLLVGSTEAAGNAQVLDLGSDLDPFMYTVVSARYIP